MPILCVGEKLQSLGEAINMLMGTAGLNRISITPPSFVSRWLLGGMQSLAILKLLIPAAMHPYWLPTASGFRLKPPVPDIANA